MMPRKERPESHQPVGTQGCKECGEPSRMLGGLIYDCPFGSDEHAATFSIGAIQPSASSSVIAYPRVLSLILMFARSSRLIVCAMCDDGKRVNVWIAHGNLLTTAMHLWTLVNIRLSPERHRITQHFCHTLLTQTPSHDPQLHSTASSPT